MTGEDGALLDRFNAGFKALPEWVRVLAVRVGISLGAALLSSLLMQAAVYVYAFRHGARIPLEGVSFVTFLGGLFGFVISLTSLFLFQYIPREVRGFRRDVFDDDVFGEYIRKHRILASFMTVGVIALIGLIMFGAHVGLNFAFIKESERPAIWDVARGIAVLVGWVSALAVLALNFSNADTRWQRPLLWIFLAVVIAAVIAVMGSPFAGFLRTIRYGGGLQVELTFTDQSKQATCLFLISDQTTTIYDAQSEAYVEIPRLDISRFQYAAAEKTCDLPYPMSRKDGLQTPAG